VRDQTSDYLDRHLSPGSRARFEHHLGSCPSCTEFVDDLRMTLDLLAGLRERPVSGAQEATVRESFNEYFPEPDLPEDLEDWTEVKRVWGELARLERTQSFKMLFSVSG
jgi:hypothetical protein